MPSAILMQDVEHLGERGAVVDVSKGYLRNYLMPRKLAQPATKGALAEARRRGEAADREVAVVLQGVGELPELLADDVELVVLLRHREQRPAIDLCDLLHQRWSVPRARARLGGCRRRLARTQ